MSSTRPSTRTAASCSWSRSTRDTPNCGPTQRHGPSTWRNGRGGIRRWRMAWTPVSPGRKPAAKPSLIRKGASMADPARGEIWLAALATGVGHEQIGPRPVLIVSDDIFNAGPAGLVMTLPLTSKIVKWKNIPAQIRTAPPVAGLKTPSVILGDQLRTISKDRLGKAPWGRVSAATMAKVENVLRVLLGL